MNNGFLDTLDEEHRNAMAREDHAVSGEPTTAAEQDDRKHRSPAAWYFVICSAMSQAFEPRELELERAVVNA